MEGGNGDENEGASEAKPPACSANQWLLGLGKGFYPASGLDITTEPPRWSGSPEEGQGLREVTGGTRSCT